MIICRKRRSRLLALQLAPSALTFTLNLITYIYSGRVKGYQRYQSCVWAVAQVAYYLAQCLTYSPNCKYENDGILYNKQFCEYCTQTACCKPPRAIHCRYCGVCVTKRDHHCIWIDNCV